MPSKYVTPITKIHSTFREAKEFYDKYGGISLFDDGKPLTLVDLVQGKRNLVVGEAGVGKTLLLEKIDDYLAENGYATKLINLRQTNTQKILDEFLGEKTDKP